MTLKPKRFRSKENLEKVRNLPCAVCKKAPPNDPDHIISRGAGGGDELSNLWSLCRPCHSKRHSFGLFRFSLKFPAAAFALYHKGFEFIGTRLVRSKDET